MKNSIDPTIVLKLEKGLPLSEAEFGRLARGLFSATLQLETDIREIKDQLSVSRPRVDPAPKIVDPPKPVRSKQDQ